MIVKLTQGDLRTKYGTFKEALYYDGQKESIALYLGDLSGAEDVLCRVHSSCIFGHYFNSVECDCQEQMDVSQQLIARAGRGIIILLDQEGKGNGHFALLNSVRFKREGEGQADAYELAGFKRDNRDFRAAAKILNDLGVSSVRMLTNNEKKVATLREQEVVVTGTKEIVL
ncbi:GTP cyclohydrolase II [Neolewinella agarilytica]|uniref:GTP cyclohydrolase II n=1 Tax=Neolewinella agarilytica TaxID=478744 RepID=A0A1H8ZVX9_9BACT|nr:GTP cyclohydrolase [Neolewinella agarilytica]SEP67908.1 GTP cyclohydrolase II [Neolewinella agarilytica]